MKYSRIFAVLWTWTAVWLGEPLVLSSFAKEIPSDAKLINSFEDLKQVIGRHQIKSVEQLLDYLRDNDPEYLKSPVYVYESRSIQPASMEYPRVILSKSREKSFGNSWWSPIAGVMKDLRGSRLK